MWTEQRWLGLGFGFSVLTNLFLVGVVTGRLYVWGGPVAPGHGHPLVPAALVRSLPQDERKRFAATMQPHREEIARRHAAVTAAKTMAEADIAATTFDRAKLEADFAAVRQTSAAEMTAVHAAYAEALAVLSPSARAALIPR